jgi:hypothetical protein
MVNLASFHRKSFVKTHGAEPGAAAPFSRAIFSAFPRNVLLEWSTLPFNISSPARRISIYYGEKEFANVITTQMLAPRRLPPAIVDFKRHE